MNRDWHANPAQGNSRSADDYGRTYLPLARPSLWRIFINTLFGMSK